MDERASSTGRSAAVCSNVVLVRVSMAQPNARASALSSPTRSTSTPLPVETPWCSTMADRRSTEAARAASASSTGARSSLAAKAPVVSAAIPSAVLSRLVALTRRVNSLVLMVLAPCRPARVRVTTERAASICSRACSAALVTPAGSPPEFPVGSPSRERMTSAMVR